MDYINKYDCFPSYEMGTSDLTGKRARYTDYYACGDLSCKDHPLRDQSPKNSRMMVLACSRALARSSFRIT